MGYRDETIALRERLEVLEPKFAELSGQIEGLSRRTALAEAETKELQRAIDLRHTINVTKYRLGVVIAILLVLSTSLALGYGYYRSSRIDETYIARQVLFADDSGEQVFSSGVISIEEGFSHCVARFSVGAVNKTISSVGECTRRYGLTFRGRSEGGWFTLSTNVQGGGAAAFRSADETTSISFVGLSSSDAELAVAP